MRFIVDISFVGGSYISKVYYAVNSEAALNMALAEYPQAESVGVGASGLWGY